MLYDNVFTQGSADVKQKEETDQETPVSVKKKLM